MYWIFITAVLIVIVILLVLRNKKKKYLQQQNPEKRQEPTLKEDVVDKEESEAPKLNDPYSIKSESVQEEQESRETDETKEVVSNLIVMRILAESGKEFLGYELLQTLLALGLRFGDMDIFHRYVNANGEGEILFSLASATLPGTFDIQNMGAFSAPGLTLFMQLDNQKNPNDVLDIMLDTAQQLVAELGGELWDDQHRHLDEVSVKRWRERINHLERSKNNYDLFANTQ